MSTRYNEADVLKIQDAYCALFPQVGGALSAFWHPENKESWACLASWFSGRRPAPSAFAGLDAALRSVDLKRSAVDIGADLHLLAQKHGVGFSIGLSLIGNPRRAA